ncbi:MAG: hypothetical protein J3K34DRAFT_517852 [Monoraphidium minutum]|nr:MAG: hypothetical protein J3K34DRAFT_517852 [Monoraphidium minutum]
MLGFLTTALPHQQPGGGATPPPALPQPGPAAGAGLASKALSGRLTLSPHLSDAVMHLTGGGPPPAGAPPPGSPPRRSSSSGGSSSGSAAADTPLSSGAQDTPQSSKGDEEVRGRITSTDAGEPLPPRALAPAPGGAAPQPGSPPRLGGAAAHPTEREQQVQPDQPLAPAAPPAPPGDAPPAPGSRAASRAASPAPPPAAAAAAAAAAAVAAHSAAHTAAAAHDQLALLQAQLCAVNERSAALEFHLRAKATEAASLEPYRRRAQELEALYALSASELARAQDQAAASQAAAVAQLKAQQLRIMVLEEQLRLAAVGSEELHTALLQQHIAAHVQAAAAQAAAAQAQAQGGGPLPLSRGGSASVLGAVSGGFDASPPGGHGHSHGHSHSLAAASAGMAAPPLQLGGLGGLMERQASLPNPPTGGLSDFARDQEVWSLRHAASGAPPRGPQRAQSLALPPGPGGAAGSPGGHGGGAWGAAAGGGGFAAAASAPLALPPLSAASSAGWDAGALLMASRQQSLLDAAAAAAAAGGGVATQSSGDLLADRADAQRLAGLLPFDLDTLGSERSDSGGPPPLPPPGRPHGGSVGGARSAALKAAAAQKQAAAAAQHLQLLSDNAVDPRLVRRWSEAWAGEVDAGAAADQHPLAAALKRLTSAPASALAALSAAASLPADTAALYGAVAAAAAARGGRASSAAGEERDAELDAAAQNARLRSKRDATPNTCVYVGFLGWWVGEKELEACFSPHGKLVSVRLLISKKSRRSREQAFVEFTDIAAAQAAIDAMDGADGPALVKQPGCGGLVVRFADRKKEDEL